jgi:uncharacterized protein
MHIEFNEAKRLKTLAERRSDFARFNEVMSGPTFTQEDTRFDYPEQRFQTYGYWMADWSWSLGHMPPLVFASSP